MKTVLCNNVPNWVRPFEIDALLPEVPEELMEGIKTFSSTLFNYSASCWLDAAPNKYLTFEQFHRDTLSINFLIPAMCGNTKQAERRLR